MITIHGIRTFGQWQERLEALLKSEDPNIEVYNYKYGYFSVVAFFIPFLRWLVTRRLRRALIDIHKERWDRIDIVAHSFGTHLVAWGLYGIEPDHRPKIHTIILAGSVLKQWFPWGNLLEDCVGRVINECGLRDKILILNQIFVVFTGMAGRLGFAGMTRDDFRNRFFSFGHSGYFMKEGKPDGTFMRERWVPLLIGEGPVLPGDDPRRATVVSGLQAFLLNNADPLKLMLYITPLVVAIWWVNGLRVEALASESRALAALSESASNQHRYVDAVKLALAAWPRGTFWGATFGDRPKLRATIRAVGKAQRLQRETIPPLRHEGSVWGAAFNDQENRVLTWSDDGTARLWDAATGQEVLPPLRHEGSVGGATFDHDENRILTWSDDATARLWDAATGQEVLPPLRHDGGVSGAAFNGDGSRILTWSYDGTARLWDAATGQEVLPPLRHEGFVDGAAFNGDENRILTWSRDGTARLWDISRLPRGHLIDIACAMLPDRGTSELEERYGIAVTKPICSPETPSPIWADLVD